MNFIEYILIMIYLINNLEYGIVVDFVDLQEIKEKYFGEVLSICIGNVVSKFFKNVMIKNGCCKDNWMKMIKCYYGIKWKIVVKIDSDI